MNALIAKLPIGDPSLAELELYRRQLRYRYDCYCWFRACVVSGHSHDSWMDVHDLRTVSSHIVNGVSEH